MTLRRRSFLSLLGLGGVGLLTAKVLSDNALAPFMEAEKAKLLPFKPVPVPLPVDSDGLSADQQRNTYKEVALEDRLTVPDGFQVSLLAAWGDPLGDSRFGFNNDHLGFLQHSADRASMTVNFEYISTTPWTLGFEAVVDRPLPYAELAAELAPSSGMADCFGWPEKDPRWRLVRAVADEAMTDLGIGVISLERNEKGEWVPANDLRDRRITGITGLRDPSQRILSTGPAKAVFTAVDRLGYNDGLEAAIIGTFANCGGGTTPWGTVLSAEENFQFQVPEPVFADGSSVSPSERPFLCEKGKLGGLGNVYGLAGNKYGWMVEVNPQAPDLPVRKHTALGRFRHEAVAVRAKAGHTLQVYSGCDRSGGHLYRYVSRDTVTDAKDKANSRLLEAGELQVARFNADGSGEWLALTPQAVVAPFLPSHFTDAHLNCPVELPHSDRSLAGAELFRDDAAVEAYRQRFTNLADLYCGEGDALQGAILVDAHLAASAIGATPTARPEDTKIDPISGDLLIAFTSGKPGDHGGADPAVFQGPQGQTSWDSGWVMRLNDSEEGRFTWRMAVTGGEPWAGGLGFSNPDNLALDRGGNLWIVTDRSMKASTSDVFGNNSCWFVPRDGQSALCFATGPMECELTGLCLDQEEQSIFVSVQHPGEVSGALSKGEVAYQNHELVDRDGTGFSQLRQVPLGSNWPTQASGNPPRPGVVAIKRRHGGGLLGA